MTLNRLQGTGNNSKSGGEGDAGNGRRETGGGRRGAPTLAGYFSGIASLLITLQFDI